MKEIEISFVSGGRAFGGVCVEPESPTASPRPGALVLHGGAGLGDHERERARMLAELGFVACAPDLFGEVFESRTRGIEVIQGLVDDPVALRTRLADALACLRAHRCVDPTKLVAIGFCFGGLAALELARSGADVRAVASLHGGLATRAPARPGETKATILVCTGSADPFVKRSERDAFEDEMNSARADWQLHVYANALHGFTVRDERRPGCGYHESSDRRSWEAMRALFAETVGLSTR